MKTLGHLDLILDEVFGHLYVGTFTIERAEQFLTTQPLIETSVKIQLKSLFKALYRFLSY